jgi:hypothetical protein
LLAIFNNSIRQVYSYRIAKIRTFWFDLSVMQTLPLKMIPSWGSSTQFSLSKGQGNLRDINFKLKQLAANFIHHIPRDVFQLSQYITKKVGLDLNA